MQCSVPKGGFVLFVEFGSEWSFVTFPNSASPTTNVNLSYACACGRPTIVFI